MGEREEKTEESDGILFGFGDNWRFKIMHLTEEILKTYDGIDDAYKDLDLTNQFLISEKISRRTELHPMPDELLKQRIKLHLEINPAEVIAAHHFAKASAECIDTYRAGFFVACTMMTHSINEGIIKFVAKRNKIHVGSEEDLPKTIDKLKRVNLLDPKSANSSKAIWRSYRNAIHHMREDISKIQDWHELAKVNLRNLTILESKVFGIDWVEGKGHPHFPQHWDIGKDNFTPMWLRFG